MRQVFMVEGFVVLSRLRHTGIVSHVEFSHIKYCVDFPN
jgi:hypothetical protein